MEVIIHGGKRTKNTNGMDETRHLDGTSGLRKWVGIIFWILHSEHPCFVSTASRFDFEARLISWKNFVR